MIRNVKILVVDDDSVNKKMVKSMLRRSLELRVGREVITCGDGFEAWQFVQSNHVDVVISDVNMPKMDGIELLKNIRNIKNNNIVFITMSADHENEVLARVHGANAFLAKPFSMNDINKLIEMFIA